MTAAGKGKRLGLVLRHDDAKREYAYDRKSKIDHRDKALDAGGPARPMTRPRNASIRDERGVIDRLVDCLQPRR